MHAARLGGSCYGDVRDGFGQIYGLQFSVGVSSRWSMMSTGTLRLCGSSLRPSCFSSASAMRTPPMGTAGSVGAGSPAAARAALPARRPMAAKGGQAKMEAQAASAARAGPASAEDYTLTLARPSSSVPLTARTTVRAAVRAAPAAPAVVVETAAMAVLPEARRLSRATAKRAATAASAA